MKDVLDRIKDQSPEPRLLQVGDVIFYQQYSAYSRIVIERVTAKRAYSGNDEFERVINSSGSISLRGGYSGFGSRYFRTATPDLEAKFLLQESKRKAHSLLDSLAKKVNSMSQYELDKLISIIQPEAQ